MTDIKTIPHICTDSALRNRNQGSMTHCDCCGRPIKGAPKFWIEVVGSGDEVAPAAGSERADSLGFFPLGPDCAKRYPTGYVSTEGGVA